MENISQKQYCLRSDNNKNLRIAADNFIDQLEKARVNNNYVSYAIILEKFEHFDTLESDFFREIFYGGTAEEIECWIDCKKYKLSVHELSLIAFEHDELFYYGLQRDNLLFDGISCLAEIYNEQLTDGLLDIKSKSMIIHRLHALVTDKRFPKKEIADFYGNLLAI